MSRARLLVIDDQVGITRVVSLIAKQLGIECKALNNPEEAAGVFIEYMPDIVVLDMVMPEKDGIDVLNEILLTGIPAQVIVTSGYSDSYLRLAQGLARFHERGQISVLKKPFRRDELVSMLQQFTAKAA